MHANNIKQSCMFPYCSGYTPAITVFACLRRCSPADALSYTRPNVAYAEVRYTYATFPRAPVTVSFGFTQEPAEWHKVASFVADLPAILRNIIEGLSRTDGGATKLLLVIIFSLVHFNNGPEVWSERNAWCCSEWTGWYSIPGMTTPEFPLLSRISQRVVY